MNLATAEGQQELLEADNAPVRFPKETPVLDIVLAEARGEVVLTPGQRKSAIAALQFCHPKLAVQTNLNLDFGTRLDRAKEAKAAIDAARAEAKAKGLNGDETVKLLRDSFARKVPPVIEGEKLPVGAASVGPVEHSPAELAAPFVTTSAMRGNRRC